MKRAWSLALSAVLVGCHAVLPYPAATDEKDIGVTAADVRGPGLLDGASDGASDGARDGESVDVNVSADGGAPDLRPTLDPLTPFNTPQPVNELNTVEDEDDPTLRGDMLEIFYDCQGGICRATRGVLTDDWIPKGVVQELSSNKEDTTPALTPDGLTIHISSARTDLPSVGGLDIFRSERAHVGDAWSALAPVRELNSVHDDLAAGLDYGKSRVVFARNPTGAFDEDLFESQKTAGGDWRPPERLRVNHAEANDGNPWIDPSATVLYFKSDRQEGNGGSRDIWVATRTDPDADFGTPQPVPGLNSSAVDEDPWLSPDLRTIYFSSDRNGSLDIFVSTR